MIDKYEIKSLEEILKLPEVNHILTRDNCDKIFIKFEELGSNFSKGENVYREMEGKTISQFVNSLGLPKEWSYKMIMVIMSAIWPARFGLIKDK